MEDAPCGERWKLKTADNSLKVLIILSAPHEAPVLCVLHKGCTLFATFCYFLQKLEASLSLILFQCYIFSYILSWCKWNLLINNWWRVTLLALIIMCFDNINIDFCIDGSLKFSELISLNQKSKVPIIQWNHFLLDGRGQSQFISSTVYSFMCHKLSLGTRHSFSEKISKTDLRSSSRQVGLALNEQNKFSIIIIVFR